MNGRRRRKRRGREEAMAERRIAGCCRRLCVADWERERSGVERRSMDPISRDSDDQAQFLWGSRSFNVDLQQIAWCICNTAPN